MGVGILMVIVAIMLLSVVTSVFRIKKEKLKDSIYGGRE